MAKKNTVVSPAANLTTGNIDPAKLAGGLNMVFKGYAMVFEAMAEQAELLGAAVPLGIPKEIPGEERSSAEEAGEVSADTAADSPSADTPPWESKPESAGTKDAQPVITTDDILKVAAQKITTNRKNSPKIKALLTSYGCAAVSELPEDKREAFLNDLAQL